MESQAVCAIWNNLCVWLQGYWNKEIQNSDRQLDNVANRHLGSKTQHLEWATVRLVLARCGSQKSGGVTQCLHGFLVQHFILKFTYSTKTPATSILCCANSTEFMNSYAIWHVAARHPTSCCPYLKGAMILELGMQWS